MSVEEAGVQALAVGYEGSPAEHARLIIGPVMADKAIVGKRAA